MKIFNRSVILISLLCFPPFSHAEAEFYAGVDAQYGVIDINGEAFNPFLGRINAGFWLRKGIGVEAMLGTALSDDKSASLNIDVPSLASLSLRLQSPEDMRTKAYALLGYGRYELDGRLGGSGFPGSETFGGPSVSLGFMRHLGTLEPFSAYLEFTGYFADKDIDFGGIGLGLRYGY